MEAHSRCAFAFMLTTAVDNASETVRTAPEMRSVADDVFRARRETRPLSPTAVEADRSSEGTDTGIVNKSPEEQKGGQCVSKGRKATRQMI